MVREGEESSVKKKGEREKQKEEKLCERQRKKEEREHQKSSRPSKKKRKKFPSISSDSEEEGQSNLGPHRVLNEPTIFPLDLEEIKSHLSLRVRHCVWEVLSNRAGWMQG